MRGRVFHRNGAWWIDFEDSEGKRHRKKIGPQKRIAEEVLRDTQAKVTRGEYLGIIEDGDISFKELIPDWNTRVLPRLSEGCRKRWDGIVKTWLLPEFGTQKAKTISLNLVEKYRSKRLAMGVSARTVNMEVQVLSHILAKGVEWGRLGKNPLFGLKKLKEAPGRIRFLDLEEIDRLLRACGPESFSSDKKPNGKRLFSSLLTGGYLKAFVLVALNTGMRRGEILSLTRTDIDWKNRIARLSKTKNGEARIVRLNETAIEALQSLPLRMDNCLFPFTKEQVTMAFSRSIRRAGIPDFRLHDLRHCFASYAAMGGVSQKALMSLLGHKDARMTHRYTHLSEDYLRQVVDGLSLGKIRG